MTDDVGDGATTTRDGGQWLRWLGPAAGVGIFVVAAGVIAGELRDVSWHEVEAAATATPLLSLMLALALLIVSLGTASTFDGLALASMGKTANWRRTWQPSVLAFALANVGAPGLAMAGGIRFRAYQADGLSGGDVAVVSALAAAIGLVGGLVLVSLAAAGALTDIADRAHLPHWVGLVLAIVGLKVLAGYLLAPRAGWLKRFLPDRKTRLAIIFSSACEWMAAATILYVLLPEASRGDLLHYLPVFGMAGLLGAVSGLPGGLGAFDAIIIAALGPRIGTADVVGALLLYRLIYVIGPLLLAGGLTVLIGLRAHGRSAAGGRAMQAGEAVWREVAPPLFGLLTFVAGVVTLLSVATPDGAARLTLLARLAPEGLINSSHFAASLAGVVLLFLAFGLLGRLRKAWWATLFALITAAFACLLKGLGFQEFLFLATVVGLLAMSRGAFHRDAGLRATPMSPGSIAAVLVVLVAAGGLGLFAYQNVVYRDDLWWTFLTEQNAPRFLRAAVGAAALAVLIFAWRLTRPAAAETRRPTAADMERVYAIMETADQASPEANLAFLGDKSLMFSESGRSFVQYGVRGRAFVAMGEPVGPSVERKAAIWAFRELCDRHGARTVFYSVSRDSLPDFIDCGLVASKIGETAIVDLENFSLEGPVRAPLRHAVNRGQRDGAEFAIVPPEGFDAIADELQSVSDAWLGIHHGVEKGFSLGRFDRDYLRRFPTAVLRKDGAIVAFANLWCTPDGHTVSIDLMRYGAGAPKNSMELLFIHLMLWGRDRGFKAFDMGMAPLSGLDSHRLAPSVARLGSFVYAEGGSLYGFEGLRAFKQKFNPRWDPVYIAAPTGWMLGPALADAALLSSGGLLGALR
ncbi:bifunctional lysylphosphatidylglycerol flippase/synthetase MprF [uncultured Brevundimonas sp.]|uniref:bifunctional lysylphosphatidylglycerol flippase/synthetase MprF n=1 Tax=uncultured Brevundimonas sp. TaxID=213418 RepID=UPI0030EF2860